MLTSRVVVIDLVIAGLLSIRFVREYLQFMNRCSQFQSYGELGLACILFPLQEADQNSLIANQSSQYSNTSSVFLSFMVLFKWSG